jgi:hypothetical protein
MYAPVFVKISDALQHSGAAFQLIAKIASHGPHIANGLPHGLPHTVQLQLEQAPTATQMKETVDANYNFPKAFSRPLFVP